MIEEFTKAWFDLSYDGYVKEIASYAYKMADAMMEAREA